MIVKLSVIKADSIRFVSQQEHVFFCLYISYNYFLVIVPGFGHSVWVTLEVWDSCPLLSVLCGFTALLVSFWLLLGFKFPFFDFIIIFLVFWVLLECFVSSPSFGLFCSFQSLGSLVFI